MNTYPSSSSNYSQSQSINPALLAGGFSNPQQQQQQRYGGGGGGFGGAGGMGGGVNPAQLMNGSSGGMNGQGQGSISANQLLHQQQQRQQHQHMMNAMNQMGGGGGMGNTGMGGMGGINPAALASSSSGNSSSSNMMNMNNVNINPMMMQNPSGSSGPPQISTAAMLNMMGITREQFAALSPQEKNAAGSKAMAIMNQQNQQMSMGMGGQGMGNMMGGGAGNMMGGGGGNTLGGGGGNMGGAGNMNNANMGGMQFTQQQNPNQQIAMGGFFDRPSSSASSHSTSNPPSNPQNQNQMMPPPPPRPSTAAGMHGMGGVVNMGGQQSGQGQGHPSRPGTSMAHRSPTIPGPGLGGGMGGMGSMHEQRMMQERMHRQQIQQMHNQQQMEQQQQQHQQQQDPRFQQQQMEHQQRMREQGMHEQQRAQEQQRMQEQQQRMQLQMGIPRPSSRMSVGPPGQIPGASGNMSFNANAGGMMNGFPQKPPQTQQQGGTGGGNIFPSQSPLSSQPHIPLPQTQTPQQQRGGQAFSSQQQHEGSPPPMSPYRGAKRKVGGPDGVMPGMASPRMGGGMALPPTTPTGAMGPPGIPRTVSGDSLGGIPSPSTGGLGNMNMNAGMQGGAGNLFQPPAQNQSLHQHHQQLQRRTQSPRPQSSMGMVPGGGMDIQIQRQRQGSNPPQFPLGNQQTPQRQGSLPPSGMMGPPPQMSKPLDPAGLMGIGVKSGMSGMSGMPGMVMPPPSAAPANPLAGMHPPTAAPGVISGGIPLPGPGAVPGGPGMGVGGVTPQQQQALASSLSAAGIPTAPGGLPAAGSSVSGAGSAAANLLAQLPPLPPGVTLNPAITRVSAVPLIESVKRIPPLSEADIKNVQAWIKVDKEYEVVFRRMKERMALEARETFGPAGASWWEKGFLGGNLNRWRRGREQFDVRYPRRREKEGRDGRERKRGVRREGLRLPRTLAPAEANRPEQLIPIRLEFDVEHHKMRDTFVWNLNDPVVTPEHFAQSLVEDYALPSSYHSFIVKSIQDQLSDYKAHSANYDGEGGELSEPEDASIQRGVLDGESLNWWESWRKRVRAEGTSRKGSKHGRKRRKVVKVEEPEDVCMDEGDGDDERPMTLEELELDEQTLHEDMRILIRLDIIVGAMKLDDQFEWDLDNTTASPEDFADVYTQELGLCGEFKTAIAHSIREQVQTYQKSLFLVGHQPSDGALVQDEDLKQSFLPSLMSGARPVSEVQMFTPLLNYLSDGEIDRTEKDRDKDLNKRRKRNTRGRRGIALPDREPIRTYRTPAIGFPELDPATLALAAAANAPMSRRAAAAAASLTIANMVASENGTPFMPQAMPSQAPQPPPTAQKEKKPKGLFKAPPIPPNTLRPRAHVVAPTPSTAADVSKLPAPLDNDPPPSANNVPALDSKAAKILSAKRAKELEREAKEKEFVDGQHPNFIDGIWHCSNCGCPESIAIGRRKGPLGDKSQCGTCGKFWHRHRRPRPVEYNADADFHSNLKQREAEAKMPASKKKSAAAALRAQSTAATPMADVSEPQTPARSNGDVEASSRQSPTLVATLNDDDRAISPVSTASSASEPPLAQRVKLNGTSHSKPPATPAHVTPVPAPSTPSPISKPPPATELPAPPSPSKAWPPAWLTTAMQQMQDKYHNDRFEVILRKVNASSSPEWRIKCLDCPGKLYTPGPGETLSNYEVHLKNRLHRQKVNERVAASSNGS